MKESALANQAPDLGKEKKLDDRYGARSDIVIHDVSVPLSRYEETPLMQHYGIHMHSRVYGRVMVIDP